MSEAIDATKVKLQKFMWLVKEERGTANSANFSGHELSEEIFDGIVVLRKQAKNYDKKTQARFHSNCNALLSDESQ